LTSTHTVRRKALVRRAIGAALVLVLALVVVGSVAAARDRTPPTDADESAGHEPDPDERHARLESVHGQIGDCHLHRLQGRSTVHGAAGPDDVHDRLAEPRPDVQLLRHATSDVTPPSAPTNVRIVEDLSCGEVWVGWTQSTDETDPQSLIEYEIYVNGVLSRLPVGGGIDRDFVYATAHGDNTFTVKAVDRAGNASEASNAFTAFLWPC
jgi:hypothetical protein